MGLAVIVGTLVFVLAELYLYVCAGSDSLWRRNIREFNSDWEYVGLADIGIFSKIPERIAFRGNYIIKLERPEEVKNNELSFMIQVKI